MLIVRLPLKILRKFVKISYVKYIECIIDALIERQSDQVNNVNIKEPNVKVSI